MPGLGNPLEKRVATHSSILPWRISWTEEPGRQQFMGSESQTHKWKIYVHKNSYMNVLSSIIHNSKKVKTIYISIKWWVDYSKCVCTVEYCSTIKRSEESTDNNAAWMKLDNIMPSERSQTQKVTYCVIPFIRNVQSREINGDSIIC